MGSEIFYLAKSKRMYVAVILYMMALFFLFVKYLWEPINTIYTLENIFSVTTLFVVIFFSAATYFLLNNRIALLKLEDELLYYNRAIFKKNIRDGAFFPFLPYMYTDLSSFEAYNNFSQMEVKGFGVFITLKKADTFSRNPMLLQMGFFSKSDRARIIETLKQHTT